MKHHISLTRFIPFVIGLAVCTGLISVCGSVSHTNYAYGAAPMRPTLVPLPAAPVMNSGAAGGHITTRIPAGAGGLRAVVQWLGRDGNWYSVEGWQSLNVQPGELLAWWVAPKDFGGGPFRWAYFTQRDSAGDSRQVPKITSVPFMLPTYVSQQIDVQ